MQKNMFWHAPCYMKRQQITLGGCKMKKVLSTLVAAIVAVAFAGVVFAAEPAPAPAAPAADVKKEEKAPAKKKAKKAKKAPAKKEEVKPAEAPAAPAAK